MSEQDLVRLREMLKSNLERRFGREETPVFRKTSPKKSPEGSDDIYPAGMGIGPDG